jgi:hypothetical protein
MKNNHDPHKVFLKDSDMDHEYELLPEITNFRPVVYKSQSYQNFYPE